MRKLSIVIVAAFALCLGIAGQTLAGPGCTASKAGNTKSACTASKGTSAQMTAADGKAHCNMTAEECAKLCGMTPEQCAQMCAGKEDCGFTMINVKGMTCGGCEKSIESTLKGIDGVNHVIKVDHKEGVALICTDTKKVEGAALTKAITDKGYEASIVPAVATSASAPATKAAGCAPGCPSAKKTGCAKSCAGMKTSDKAETKKTSGAQ